MTALRFCLRRSLALLLCALMLPIPALCAPDTAPAPRADAGVVSAILTSATRNSSPVRLRETISWNDLLQTDKTGRMRFALKDGSILSLGPDSELRVIEHDPDAQLTDLDLQHGRLRSRVVSLTKPDAHFEITTPVAVVHVVGTDFFLNQSTAGHLQLIVYSGHVLLNGTGTLKGQSVEVSAGQFVEVGQNGISQPQPTPVSVQRDSINSTTIEGSGPNGEPAVASSHMLKTMLVVLGVAAVGAATSIAVNSGSGAHPAQTPSVAASPSAAPPSQPAASQPAVSKKK